MRNRLVVCYDISDPKRLRRMFKKMRGFGDPLQLSVFVCDLSETERVLLEEMVLEVINQKEDRVLIIDVGPSSGRGTEAVQQIGRITPLPEQRSAVVV